jgi:hypothetical protein
LAAIAVAGIAAERPFHLRRTSLRPGVEVLTASGDVDRDAVVELEQRLAHLPSGGDVDVADLVSDPPWICLRAGPVPVAGQRRLGRRGPANRPAPHRTEQRR